MKNTRGPRNRAHSPESAPDVFSPRVGVDFLVEATPVAWGT